MRHLFMGPGRHTHPHAGGPTVGTLTRVSQRHLVEWRVLHPMAGVPVHVQREEGERGRGTRTQWDQSVTQTSQVVPGIASQVPLSSETQPNVDTDRHVTAVTRSALGSSASPVPFSQHPRC